MLLRKRQYLETFFLFVPLGPSAYTSANLSIGLCLFWLTQVDPTQPDCMPIMLVQKVKQQKPSLEITADCCEGLVFDDLPKISADSTAACGSRTINR